MDGKLLGQIGIISIVLFVAVFILGSQTNLLSLTEAKPLSITGSQSFDLTVGDKPLSIFIDNQPFTLCGILPGCGSTKCTSSSQCGSSICLYDSGCSGANKYGKFSGGPICTGSASSPGYCNYPNEQPCTYNTASCSGSACSTSSKYCCGTPTSSGSCQSSPSAYTIYKVNTDCSYAAVVTCPDKCSNGQTSCPAPTCSVSYACSGQTIVKTNIDCSTSNIATCDGTTNQCVSGQSTCQAIAQTNYKGSVTLN